MIAVVDLRHIVRALGADSEDLHPVIKRHLTHRVTVHTTGLHHRREFLRAGRQITDETDKIGLIVWLLPPYCLQYFQIRQHHRRELVHLGNVDADNDLSSVDLVVQAAPIEGVDRDASTSFFGNGDDLLLGGSGFRQDHP